jgi:hypothetical protein
MMTFNGAGVHLHFVQIPLQFLLKLPLEAF